MNYFYSYNNNIYDRAKMYIVRFPVNFLYPKEDYHLALMNQDGRENETGNRITTGTEIAKK